MHYQIIILWLVDFVNSNMLQLESISVILNCSISSVDEIIF